jgi:hypothetical protein
MSRRNHPLFYRWNNMIARCYCKGSPSYKNYGARGITVDQRWCGYPEGFKAFVANMGAPPSANMTIERVDNEGPYSPDNCIWADRRAQALNRRRTIWIVAVGITLCVRDWAHRLGVDAMGLKHRARALGSYETAIESYKWWPRGKRIHYRPSANARWVTIDGESLTLADWQRQLGVSPGGLGRPYGSRHELWCYNEKVPAMPVADQLSACRERGSALAGTELCDELSRVAPIQKCCCPLLMRP